MYTLERFYIISKFFKSENDRNARPTTHNISQQRQKEFLLKDVMKLHEGHEFMEKILRANDFSRRLRTVLLRAALRVLKSMHRRQANAFISWRLLASNDDPWRQAEKYRWQAQRIATFNYQKSCNFSAPVATLRLNYQKV